ncbi:Clp protease N-terminal domain-containing protein [Actinomadura sp. HBU206391]|uniref:Clp protease N-terminal domain-containing protein n=1 Tax=Actinomadura sp. HBU206391 TaxID=2731692 RepID=UPI00164F6656|nr:hypothetical protein [Actinomadura sp. HBU206391]
MQDLILAICFAGVERKDPTTGTIHLLTALLADSDDPCTTLLVAIGVDTDELRRARSVNRW